MQLHSILFLLFMIYQCHSTNHKQNLQNVLDENQEINSLHRPNGESNSAPVEESTQGQGSMLLVFSEIM